MELGYILLVLFHDIIKKGMVNLLKKQLTANEIRYRTYDYITTRHHPSYIPAMHRIHGGTPSGRPLRYRIQAMGEKEVTDCKKIHGQRPCA